MDAATAFIPTEYKNGSIVINLPLTPLEYLEAIGVNDGNFIQGMTQRELETFRNKVAKMCGDHSCYITATVLLHFNGEPQLRDAIDRVSIQFSVDSLMKAMTDSGIGTIAFRPNAAESN